MSPWPECDGGRRLFYGKLAKYGLGDSHLTDFYKARGKSGALRSWKKTGLPLDWQTAHRPILEAELRIVQPKRIIAIGGLAHDLLYHFMPGVRSRLTKMLHFADGVKPTRLHDFEAALRIACDIPPSTVSASRALLQGQGLSTSFKVRRIYAIGTNSASRLNPQESALVLTLSGLSPRGHFVGENVLRNALQKKIYLETKQDPWRIWKYYESGLVTRGLVYSHCLAEM